jgi:PAS domain S-box-containing protein
MKDLDYRKIIESSPTAFAYHQIILDEDNNPCDYIFLDANKRFEELTGLKRENILNKKVTDVLPEVIDGDFDWISYYGDIALNGGSVEFEQFSKPLDRWYKVKVVSTERYYFTTYFSDIEEEMKIAGAENYLNKKNNKIDFQSAADRIRELSEAKYVFFNVYEKNEDIIKTTAVSGNRKHVQKAISMLGIELIGWKWQPSILENKIFKNNVMSRFSSLKEITGDVIPAAVIEKIEQVFSIGSTYILKLEKDKDIIGYFIIVMEKGKELNNRSLIRIYNQQIALIIEAQKNKEKLNKTEERLKLAMDASEQIFWDIDLDAEEIYINPKFYQKLGYQTGELSLEAGEMLELIHPDDRQFILDGFNSLMEDLSNFKTELRIKSKDNVWKWFLISAKAFDIDSNGKPHRIVGVSLDIDERIKQEKALKKSRQKFSDLAEEAPIGILTCDIKGNITYLNSKVAEIMGSPDKEKTKKINLLEFPLLRKNNISQKIKKCIDNKLTKTYEINYTTKWGKNIWCRVHISPKMERNKVVGAQIIVDDITEKREIQEKLKTNEKNFRTFFETIDDLILVGDLDGKIIYTNSAVSKKLGFSNEKLRKMEILDVHPQNKRDEAKEILNDMFAGKKDICPLPLRRKDNTLLPVETKIWFGKWDGQDVIFAISKDLTKEQEALQKFNKLFENNPALMAVSTIPDGKFVEVNKSFLDKLGYSEDEIIGFNSKELDLFFKPEIHKMAAEILQNKGSINNIELKVRRKNGEILDGLFSGEIIESQGKRYFLTVMTDITEQKKAEKELVEMNEKLQQSIKKANEMAAKADKANKLKSQFLANMTHEIRTPLNIIMGYTEELRKELKNEKSSKYIELILSAGESLLNQVNDILDMSKIEAGMIEMNYEYIDLEKLIHDITSIFKERVRKKDLDFKLDIDALPDLLKIDKSKFRQILINLLDNAVKFTKEGFISLKVISSKDAESRNEEEKLNLSIIIEDTGIGIEEEKIEEIFNAFSQQNGQSTREYGGTGLGLAITKKLIKLLGGEITVQSSKGVGSKFKIDFFDLEYKNEKKPKIRDEHKNDGYDFSGAKILVVDDEELNRELIKIKLSDKNIKIVEAENGRQAVEMAEKEKPDLIIMDLKMPEMDGYQALEKIRALNKSYYNLPVVALTAAATEVELNMSKASGFNDFISKPLVEGRLYEILVEYLIIDE